MAEKYLLRVTAGHSYDPTTHQPVLVNQPTPTHITSSLCTANISVRIQNYRGLPPTSPPSSPYFTHPPHTHDAYSISLTFTPHHTIPATSLLFGNDFDAPIRDRIPPGFNAAFRIVKWVIDPGLEGDVYAERPWLYGNALSSFNIVRVGERIGDGGLDEKGGLRETEGDDGGKVLEEGGDGEGVEWRKQRAVPDGAGERKTWALGKGKEGWEWEGGRVYRVDFFNPYLDFNQFALKLPGFNLSILPYLGGNDYLRYVLKNKDTDEVLLVVVFTLLHREDVEKEEAEVGKKSKAVVEKGSEPKQESESGFKPEADDVD